MTGKLRRLSGLSIVAGCAVLAFAVWRTAPPGGSISTKAPASQPSPPKENVAAQPKPRGFDQVLAVLAKSGTPLEVEQAIIFLDTTARLRKGMTDAQHTALVAALERGTPAAMVEGAWSHLFNSACNALATGRPAPDEDLLSLLEHVAAADPRPILRLYALQHIGCHYAAAAPESRRRLRALVQRMLADPSSQTAGTALVLWRSWEKTAGPGEITSFDLSRAIAADPGRPVDVRVAALHAVGDDPGVLELARALALNRAQPMILRKAALNLIGRHGVREDLETLRLCSREGSRLAQAGDPAARSLQDRLAGRPQPVLRPYQ